MCLTWLELLDRGGSVLDHGDKGEGNGDPEDNEIDTDADAFPDLTEESQCQGNDEADLGGFAPEIAVHDDTALQHGGTAEDHDQFLAHNDDDGDPGEDSGDALTDQGGADHQLIRQRIEKLSEIGNEVIFTGNLAIQHIGEAGQKKNTQGPVTVCLNFFRCLAGEEEDHKHGDQQDPQNGQYIGYVPHVGKQATERGPQGFFQRESASFECDGYKFDG